MSKILIACVAGFVLSLTVGAAWFAYPEADAVAESCCYPGSECCYSGSPCCGESAPCCEEGASCCTPPKACCASATK